ncbi:hypothetical protein [Nocardioides panaciterrulae]|uniref:Allene oxide cyclase barrel-like domain-containing protein n=1 Tax=Nocardioides panaciterrulae TaxID=661492 RepID=A0A7Y9E6M6_9ACTN|nr:hypothetical protein [Nocardioides panaciterrulae]NYD41942.1 hypothetical protein [Nocardioides panaciterrulae]
MRSTQPLLALAAAATSALTGLGVASAGAAAPATTVAAAAPATAAAAATEGATTREFGYVIECGGTIRGRTINASLYENNRHPAVIQVLLGSDGDQVGGSREVADGFVDHTQVHGSIRVGGHRAVIEGHASRLRHRTQVHEEYTDAGQEIVVDGYHRKLVGDLTLTWRHRTVPLTCDNAFFYDLQVTKTDITG